MHTLIRSSLAVVGLVLAACGGERARSPSPTTPSATSSPVTTDSSAVTTVVPTTSSPATTAPAPTDSSTTSSTIPVVTTEFVTPVAINSQGEVVLNDGSISSGPPGPPDYRSRAVVMETRMGGRRNMPLTGTGTFASSIGLNDAGLVAGTLTDSGLCTPNAPPDCATTDAFVWDSVGGGVTSLPDWTAIAGPNAAGLVVVFQDPDGPYTPGGDEMAVWHTATGELTVVEGFAPYSGGVFLNDRGQILGRASTDVVVWDVQTGRVEVLGDAAGGRANRLVGLDNSGRAVARDDIGHSGVYVWQPADRQWHQLVGPDGEPPSGMGASAVSGGGLVAGSTHEPTWEGKERPTYWVDVWVLDSGLESKRIELDGDLLYVAPVDLNDAGQMLALGDVADRSLPYLYEPTTGTWTELLLDRGGV